MSNRLRSDATQPIAEAIQDTMMRKWTPLDEAAAYVLDALLTYLEAHTEHWRTHTGREGSYILTEGNRIVTVAELISLLRVEP